MFEDEILVDPINYKVEMKRVVAEHAKKHSLSDSFLGAPLPRRDLSIKLYDYRENRVDEIIALLIVSENART